jgi:hypothetical protein
LFRDGRASDARHGIIVASQAASGDVFLRMTAARSRYADDTHRQLAHALLWDATVLDGDWLQAVNRRSTSSGAGFTATESVFWNTRVVSVHRTTVNVSAGFPLGVAVESAQWGWGYVIGTAGAATAVATRAYTNTYWSGGDVGDPRDWVEGAGRGVTLYPPSLYEAQLAARMARGGR